MIPIYICEDERAIRAFVSKAIQNYIVIENLDMEIACDTADPKKILDAIRSSSASGVYFLDIDLGIPTFTGFDLAREIRRRDPGGAIVFVTTHGELSMETFRYRLEALDYILKDDMPAMEARVKECLASVQKRIEARRHDQSGYYTVKVFDTLYNIALHSIFYFETSPQKHRIILHAEDQMLEFFGNLQTIEDTIGSNFWRCHRSFLVNRAQVAAVHLKHDEVELINGVRCPLSRRAKKIMQSGEA